MFGEGFFGGCPVAAAGTCIFVSKNFMEMQPGEVTFLATVSAAEVLRLLATGTYVSPKRWFLYIGKTQHRPKNARICTPKCGSSLCNPCDTSVLNPKTLKTRNPKSTTLNPKL